MKPADCSAGFRLIVHAPPPSPPLTEGEGEGVGRTWLRRSRRVLLVPDTIAAFVLHDASTDLRERDGVRIVLLVRVRNGRLPRHGEAVGVEPVANTFVDAERLQLVVEAGALLEPTIEFREEGDRLGYT